MEPGHEDREYLRVYSSEPDGCAASMEPGHEDREYAGSAFGDADEPVASMEPGHEDREYILGTVISMRCDVPQWSPVMKTGNTQHNPGHHPNPRRLNGARS